jgi:hypothetical protein
LRPLLVPIVLVLILVVVLDLFPSRIRIDDETREKIRATFVA